MNSASWGNHFPDLVKFNLEGQWGTHRRGHNIYGMQMSRATYEGTRRLMGGHRPFVLTRATYAGGQRYSAIWTGDNQPTDDHMMTGVRLVSSLGLSGYPFAGVDVGGFAGDGNSNLFARWIQVGAFTPFFRGHTMVDTKDKEPWAHGEKVEEISRNFISLRYRLMPYLYSAFYEASKTGMPVSRSLAIDYTFDPKIYDWNYNSQYIFGNGLLVAPTPSYEEISKVYLPAGKWYNFYTGEQLEGGKEMLVETPIDRLALYVKGGSIIPMMSQVQSLSEQPNDTLYLHVYWGDAANTFMYYEDAGDGYEYQQGASQVRQLVFDPVKKSLTLETPVGSFPSRFKHVKLMLHGFEGIALKSGKQPLKPVDEKVAFLQPLSVFDPLGSAGSALSCPVRTLVFPFDGSEVKINW
jgi:alpha-glucosidase